MVWIKYTPYNNILHLPKIIQKKLMLKLTSDIIGIVHPKGHLRQFWWKFCHHLLNLILFLIYKTLVTLQNTNEGMFNIFNIFNIFKTFLDLLRFGYMDIQWRDRNLSSCRLTEVLCGSVKYDRIVICGWTVHLLAVMAPVYFLTNKGIFFFDCSLRSCSSQSGWTFFECRYYI